MPDPLATKLDGLLDGLSASKYHTGQIFSILPTLCKLQNILGTSQRFNTSAVDLKFPSPPYSFSSSGSFCELVESQASLGGSGLVNRPFPPDNRAWPLCQLLDFPSFCDPLGTDKSSEAKPCWELLKWTASYSFFRWNHMHKVSACAFRIMPR